MSEFISINCSGTFLKNAGIVGIIRFFEKNEAKKGNDYIIDGQELKISVDYLLNNDIAQMYFDTVTEEFEKQTKFYRVTVEERKIIDSYEEKRKNPENSGNEKDDKKKEKDVEDKLKSLYKSFEDEMTKNSYKKVFNLLAGISDLCPDDIKDFKKEKDWDIKYQKYNNIIDKVNEVKKQFIYTFLLYSDFRFFFVENKTSHVIPALDDSKKNRHDTIHDKFFKDIETDINADEKKKKYFCIECMNRTSEPQDNTFMVDTADDTTRKKSYYWNCNADAYVCPICAMLYLFAPLGFVFIGRTAVFINNNSSVDVLYRTMSTYRDKNDKNDNYYARLYGLFTNEKIDALKHTVSNIQVILKEENSEHYNMKIIDKNIIEKLIKTKKEIGENGFKSIEMAKSLTSDNKTRYGVIYNQMFDNIFAYRSLYGLIDKCMRDELAHKNNKSWHYISCMLKTEIIFNGGSEMDNLIKFVNGGFVAGKLMREEILGEKAHTNNNDNEDDNSLRGYVYRLINLSSVGDTAQFMDTILRQYSGYSLAIPPIFKNCYESEEVFKAIAHGYILGLKCSYTENKDTNN